MPGPTTAIEAALLRVRAEIESSIPAVPGGYNMGMLAAACRLGYRLIVVWSNAGGALIRSGVRAQRIQVPSALHTWQRPPRFGLVASGWGIRSLTVRTARGLTRTLAAALRASEPVLIEAMINPDAEVPAVDRYRHLDASESSR